MAKVCHDYKTIGIVQFFGIFFDFRYLNEDEILARGGQGIISASFMHAQSMDFFTEIFFNHTILGETWRDEFLAQCLLTNREGLAA